MILPFILLTLQIASSQSLQAKPKCAALEKIDDAWSEIWDFHEAEWTNSLTQTIPIQVNRPPMIGNYSFHVSFCGTITASNVNDGKDQYQFGTLSSFEFADPSRNDTAGKEFEQTYKSTKGYPPQCPTPVSAALNVYCTYKIPTDCREVPGSTSADCISPVSSMEKYCICSIQWTDTTMCNSLVVNILSTECPDGVPIANPRTPQSRTAIAFGVIFALICCAWIGVTIWRVSQGRRGVHALPFSDYFTQEAPPQVYTARGNYETL